jgi:hypothetical protein
MRDAAPTSTTGMRHSVVPLLSFTTAPRQSGAAGSVGFGAVAKVETVEDIPYPIPAALVASRYSFRHVRQAPAPLIDEHKSRTLLKRFCGRIEWFAGRWDASKDRKCATEKEKGSKKLKAKQRWSESIIRAKNRKFAMKQGSCRA